MELQAPEEAVKAAYEKGTAEEKNLLEKLFGKQSFLPEWWKDFELACKTQGLDAATALPYANPKNGHEDALNAVAALFILAEWEHNGWVADWNDTSQQKWEPIFDMRAGCVLSRSYYDYSCTRTYAGSRLSFPTEKRSNDFARKYISLYKKFLTK